MKKHKRTFFFPLVLIVSALPVFREENADCGLLTVPFLFDNFPSSLSLCFLVDCALPVFRKEERMQILIFLVLFHLAPALQSSSKKEQPLQKITGHHQQDSLFSQKNPCEVVSSPKRKIIFGLHVFVSSVN